MRQGLSRSLSVAVMVAMLGQQPPLAARRVAAADGAPQSDAARQGQCRTPALLPQLGAETWQQRNRPGTGPMPRPVMAERATDVMAPSPPVPPPPPPPPPPSPSSVVASETDAAASTAEVIVTGTRADGARRSAKPEAAAEDARVPGRAWPRHRPQPQPQAGLLTAGEHDDLLNPELYADYVRRSNLAQDVPDLPRLDTARVLTVAVRDNAGAPVGRASVEVQCEDGNRIVLSTMSDGTVTLFPLLDRLSRTVKVRAAGQDWREVAIARGAGGQTITFSGVRPEAGAPKLDLMLAIDTTGSMGDEIRYLQTELAAILDRVRASHPGLDVRLGFVFYRDVGDDYVTNTVPLSRDFGAGQAALRERWAGGGGDYPEAMEQALIRAAGQNWRPDAVKTMLLVADAPPHDENMGTAWLAAEHLRAARVHVVPVAASGVADKAEYAMRAMAALTQSRYTFLTDDSGVGNPHAPPAIDCYLVTRLDALLGRVIDSQIAGRRIEPSDNEVLREVGQYDKGRCIIPRGRLQQG